MWLTIAIWRPKESSLKITEFLTFYLSFLVGITTVSAELNVLEQWEIGLKIVN